MIFKQSSQQSNVNSIIIETKYNSDKSRQITKNIQQMSIQLKLNYEKYLHYLKKIANSVKRTGIKEKKSISFASEREQQKKNLRKSTDRSSILKKPKQYVKSSVEKYDRVTHDMGSLQNIKEDKNISENNEQFGSLLQSSVSYKIKQQNQKSNYNPDQFQININLQKPKFEEHSILQELSQCSGGEFPSIPNFNTLQKVQPTKQIFEENLISKVHSTPIQPNLKVRKFLKYQKTIKQTSEESSYKSFIKVQSQVIEKQKSMIVDLKKTVQQLNNNDKDIDQSDDYNADENLVDQPELIFKYLLNEIVDLYTIIEIIKNKIYYKSYQILTKMYNEANKQLQNDKKLHFSNQIKSQVMINLLHILLPQQNKAQIHILMSLIFGQQISINYLQFMNFLKPIIDEQLAIKLEPLINKNYISAINCFKKLLLSQIQIHYYQIQIKKLFRKYNNIRTDFQNKVCTFTQINSLYLENYLSGNHKTKFKSIKINIYLQRRFNKNPSINNFYKWVSQF